ncbi:MAG: mechanosensitive ion channel [Gammaproteobacteria bacterium]|nr:mechanosensitive ion channel [Gammaproteobacteria bacterium]
MLTLVALAWALARLGRVIENRLAGAARRTAADWDDLLLPLLGSAARLMLPLLAVLLAAPTLGISPGLRSLLQNLLSVVLIGCFAFLLMKAVDAGTELLLSRYRIDVPDNLEARAVHTQVTVLRKVAMVAIGLFAVASMLMVFEPVRRLGATLLASAGVAGIMLGFAAQRSIATLLAGFQIAMTQPIRVNDVVIVEGEWGRIEEITLTYVVVAIWDQRRLVLPINYFIEQPFQNWTRSSAEILGTVFLHVDYTVPLAELRSEFERLVRASPLWDGRVQGVQVTDAKESTLELRCLASAADASKAWGLRCELREKLVDWMQRNHPESLPRARAMVSTMGSARGSGVLQPAT